MRSSKQRDIILNELCSRYDHPTAQELYDTLKVSHPSLGLATVYRNLNLLAESGQITRITSEDADHFDAHIQDHCHFTCKKCGKISDIKLNCSNDLLLSPENFNGKIESYNLMYIGLCENCKES